MGIIFKQVGYTYQPQTPFSEVALQEIDLQLAPNRFYAIVGHTGSGKSTLIQMLNGLLLPTTGEVLVGAFQLAEGDIPDNIKALRKKVGMVFQFPESQLFEETVEKEICFGPINFGFSEEEAKRRAENSLLQLGLPLSFLQRSPFSLSGGEMRKVAIASVLAVQPDVLVLDEPTAGLDTDAQSEMLTQFVRMQNETGCTIILVTHQMDDVARYADEVVVMKKGRLLRQGSCAEIFQDTQLLAEANLELPTAVQCQKVFEQRFGRKLPICCYTMEMLAQQLQVIWEGEG